MPTSFPTRSAPVRHSGITDVAQAQRDARFTGSRQASCCDLLIGWTRTPRASAGLASAMRTPLAATAMAKGRIVGSVDCVGWPLLVETKTPAAAARAQSGCRNSSLYARVIHVMEEGSGNQSLQSHVAADAADDGDAVGATLRDTPVHCHPEAGWTRAHANQVGTSELESHGTVPVSAPRYPESSSCAVLLVRSAVADEQISFLGNTQVVPHRDVDERKEDQER